MSEYILIIGGQAVSIDEDRYNLSKYYNWHLLETKTGLYVQGRLRSDDQKILMHRVIVEAEGIGIEGVDVDHKDGNGLNNQRSNLRVATRSQNLANRPPDQRNTSGYKGVTFSKRANKWKAQIKVKGENINLGHFDLPESAAIAYNHAAKQFYGQFAWLNNLST